jgi:hypothetical protein
MLGFPKNEESKRQLEKKLRRVFFLQFFCCSFLKSKQTSVIIGSSYEFAARKITRETGRETEEGLDQLAG